MTVKLEAQELKTLVQSVFSLTVGVKDFSSPEAVVHIDRIYIPETAPRIHVNAVNLIYPDDRSLELMRNGEYTIF